MRTSLVTPCRCRARPVRSNKTYVRFVEVVACGIRRLPALRRRALPAVPRPARPGRRRAAPRGGRPRLRPGRPDRDPRPALAGRPGRRPRLLARDDRPGPRPRRAGRLRRRRRARLAPGARRRRGASPTRCCNGCPGTGSCCAAGPGSCRRAPGWPCRCRATSTRPRTGRCARSPREPRVARPTWRPMLRGPRRSTTPSGTPTLLTGAGCAVDAWETTYVHLLPGPRRRGPPGAELDGGHRAAAGPGGPGRRPAGPTSGPSWACGWPRRTRCGTVRCSSRSAGSSSVARTGARAEENL